MTEREALKLALEALQKIYIAPEHEEYIRVWWPACEQAIPAIKEALAQPEHEWVRGECVKCGKSMEQPEQEQLMSDQINYGMSVTQGGKRIDPMSIYKEPEQEPVAAECKFDTETSWGRCSIEHHNLVQSEPMKWPQYQTRLLYTTPPPVAEPHKRKPLTDEEIILIVAECASSHQHTDIHFARAIEEAHGIKGLV